MRTVITWPKSHLHAFKIAMLIQDMPKRLMAPEHARCHRASTSSQAWAVAVCTSAYSSQCQSMSMDYN